MNKVYKSRQIEAALLKKGFQKSKKHHRYYNYYDENGKKQRFYAYFSNSSPEYTGGLLNALQKELELDAKQFDGVVSCTVSAIELRKIYVNKI